MLVVVVDNSQATASVGPWSEYHKNGNNANNSVHDYLTAVKDYNSVTFCYHYEEITDDGGDASGTRYQSLDNFKKQVDMASKHFSDCDFQLITFNVSEEEKFGSSMKELGFEHMSSALGRGSTPITLYIKTKGN